MRTYSVDSSKAHFRSGSESSDVEISAADGVGDPAEVEGDLKTRGGERESASS